MQKRAADQAGSVEDKRQLAEIGAAITQLDTVTHQNAALVEQSTAATDSMAEMSAQLAQRMPVFRLER